MPLAPSMVRSVCASDTIRAFATGWQATATMGPANTVVPAGLDAQGLPLGLQLIGKPFDEETLFALGQKIEDAAGSFAPEKWW